MLEKHKVIELNVLKWVQFDFHNSSQFPPPNSQFETLLTFSVLPNDMQVEQDENRRPHSMLWL